MKFQLAIFDFDGTLADTLPWMRSVFNELADEYGFRRVQPDEYERFRHLDGMGLLRALDLPLWKLPRVANRLRCLMAEHTHQLGLFPGISDMLRRLTASGVRLGVVSSNSRSNVERILARENANHIAHFACGASMFGKAAKLRQVVRASKLAPQSAIYIGDEVRDGEAASKAGVAFGAVTWGQHFEEALRRQNPALCFQTAAQIVVELCRTENDRNSSPKSSEPPTHLSR